jgi:hypothetical protein
MNDWCNSWLFTHISLGILIFKGITARRLDKPFGVKGLIAAIMNRVNVYYLSFSQSLIKTMELLIIFRNKQ